MFYQKLLIIKFVLYSFFRLSANCGAPQGTVIHAYAQRTRVLLAEVVQRTRVLMDEVVTGRTRVLLAEVVRVARVQLAEVVSGYHFNQVG